MDNAIKTFLDPPLSDGPAWTKDTYVPAVLFCALKDMLDGLDDHCFRRVRRGIMSQRNPEVAPGDSFLYGRDQLKTFLNAYLASFPKGRFRVHHWIVNEDAGKNMRIALRRTYSAEHSGAGFFGEPTGDPVVIMAMTHAELQEDLVVREYHAIDDLSLWMQIHSHSMT